MIKTRRRELTQGEGREGKGVEGAKIGPTKRINNEAQSFQRIG